MITRIGEKDHFGYDDAGRPCIVQIASDILVAGYSFCARLKQGQAVGFEFSHLIYTTGEAHLILYSPTAKMAELWSGKWKEDDPRTYTIINPSHAGLFWRSFDSTREIVDFLKEPGPKALRPGYLSTGGDLSKLVLQNIQADGLLAESLRTSPLRYANKAVDRSKIDASEIGAIADLDYLIKNLFEYVYRIDAAEKLNSYADAMHFSEPTTIPQTPEKFSLLIEWKQMAARDAAFSVFHFQRTLEEIREKFLGRCPLLRAKIDQSRMRIAWKLYKSQFGNAVQTRHAIGHAGEFYRTSDLRKKHSVEKDVFVELVMLNSTLSMPVEGRFVSIDVSRTTVARLDKIKNLILDALSSVPVSH